MSTNFKRLGLKEYAPIQERETPEARFWRKFGGTVVSTTRRDKHTPF